jgi:peroxiredoxin
MRTWIVLLIIISGVIISGNLLATGKPVNIEVNVKGFENQDLILGYYYNKRMYVSDTVRFNSKGTAIFQKDELLPGGLYLFYLPSGKYFDVLIDKEQHFTISTDTTDLVKNQRITGASDPKLFLDYQHFIMDKQLKYNELRKISTDDLLADAEKSAASQEMKTIDNQVKNYWKRVSVEHEGSFFATFITAMQEPEIPVFELPAGTVNPDSVKQMKTYLFIRHHYFDNVDFQDERLLRTPFFVQKLENYFDRGIVQVPDTITRASIEIIERSRGNKDVFRFLVQFLFNRANESKVMGMDATMVALAEKYYLSGDADWASEEFLKTLGDRVSDIKPTLLGNLAHDLRMESISGESFRLHEINAQATIVVFYEPSCGHCKKEIPALYRNVFEPFRDKGVQVFAVYSMNNREEWVNFIDDHELYNWINVYDPYHQTRFRSYYDIRSTPMIYVLDRQKKIAAKRLDVEQLPGFLDHLLKNQQ